MYIPRAGPVLIIPLGVERAVKVDMRVFTRRREQREAMTKDNVPVQANTVIWLSIVNRTLPSSKAERAQRRHSGGAHHTAHVHLHRALDAQRDNPIPGRPADIHVAAETEDQSTPRIAARRGTR